MTTAVIIDVIVVVFLVAFTIYGAKRGLLQSLAGLVILVVSLVGAGMIATSFSAPAAKVVAPLLEKQIVQKVEAALEEQIGSENWAQLNIRELFSEAPQVYELLEKLGVDETAWDSAAEKLQGSAVETGAAMAEEVTGIVLEEMVRSILYAVLFVLAFLLLMLLLHVLLAAMGLVMKLPGLNLLNTLGGGLAGLIQGALLLFLAVWVGRRLGVPFETELLSEAHILRIFTTYTPLSVLSFLH